MAYTQVVCCSKLYWVDSKLKTLDSVNINDGSGHSSVSLGDSVGSEHVYGLAIVNNKAYISGWKNNISMLEVRLPSGTPTVYKSGLSGGAVFSNAYVLSQQSGNSQFLLNVSLIFT